MSILTLKKETMACEAVLAISELMGEVVYAACDSNFPRWIDGHTH
jgi:hypothetical protein